MTIINSHTHTDVFTPSTMHLNCTARDHKIHTNKPHAEQPPFTGVVRCRCCCCRCCSLDTPIQTVKHNYNRKANSHKSSPVRIGFSFVWSIPPSAASARSTVSIHTTQQRTCFCLAIDPRAACTLAKAPDSSESFTASSGHYNEYQAERKRNLYQSSSGALHFVDGFLILGHGGALHDTNETEQARGQVYNCSDSSDLQVDTLINQHHTKLQQYTNLVALLDDGIQLGVRSQALKTRSFHIY